MPEDNFRKISSRRLVTESVPISYGIQRWPWNGYISVWVKSLRVQSLWVKRVWVKKCGRKMYWWKSLGEKYMGEKSEGKNNVYWSMVSGWRVSGWRVPGWKCINLKVSCLFLQKVQQHINPKGAMALPTLSATTYKTERCRVSPVKVLTLQVSGSSYIKCNNIFTLKVSWLFRH